MTGKPTKEFNITVANYAGDKKKIRVFKRSREAAEKHALLIGRLPGNLGPVPITVIKVEG